MTDYSDSLQDQKPNPVCGARVDYHGGTCGKPVGHDEPCAPFVEPERMPCGHTHAAIVSSGEGTSYCGECVEACSPDDYETGPEDAEQMGAEAERARIKALFAEWFQYNMNSNIYDDFLAAIDGGPTDA